MSQPSRTLPCPKEGLQPPPKALPLARGRDATAPPRRSDTKVCSTHQRVGIVLRNIVAIVCAGKARPCGSRDFGLSPSGSDLTFLSLSLRERLGEGPKKSSDLHATHWIKVLYQVERNYNFCNFVLASGIPWSADFLYHDLAVEMFFSTPWPNS